MAFWQDQWHRQLVTAFMLIGLCSSLGYAQPLPGQQPVFRQAYESTPEQEQNVSDASPAADNQIALAANTGVPESTGGHPLDPALKMARESLQHIQDNVDDYTALFVKRCRVDGVLPEMQYSNVKIRNRKVEAGKIKVPLSVYIDFLRPAKVRGREVIWVENKNDGNMVVHESGLKNFMNVNLAPDSYLAMRGQKHPISEIGIENLAVKLIETGERDLQYDECEVKFFNDAKVGKEVCTMLQVIHPVERAHFDFYCARVYFSNELNMPIRYESWSWPETADGKPVLEEEYNYVNVKVNVGLTDNDFDTDNAEYRFW